MSGAVREPRPNARYDGYAILRLDVYAGDPDPLIDMADSQFGFTVKKVPWDREDAEAEVARLNELKETKGSVYFWQLTRVEKVEGAGPDRTT